MNENYIKKNINAIRFANYGLIFIIALSLGVISIASFFALKSIFFGCPYASLLNSTMMLLLLTISLLFLYINKKLIIPSIVRPKTIEYTTKEFEVANIEDREQSDTVLIYCNGLLKPVEVAKDDYAMYPELYQKSINIKAIFYQTLSDVWIIHNNRYSVEAGSSVSL